LDTERILQNATDKTKSKLISHNIRQYKFLLMNLEKILHSCPYEIKATSTRVRHIHVVHQSNQKTMGRGWRKKENNNGNILSFHLPALIHHSSF
jgi:hypothetical protein